MTDSYSDDSFKPSYEMLMSKRNSYGLIRNNISRVTYSRARTLSPYVYLFSQDSDLPLSNEVKMVNHKYSTDYFLAALASLSDETIKGIIGNSSYSTSYGAFAATFYIKGVPT